MSLIIVFIAISAAVIALVVSSIGRTRPRPARESDGDGYLFASYGDGGSANDCGDGSGGDSGGCDGGGGDGGGGGD